MRRYGLTLVLVLALVVGGVFVVTMFSQSTVDCEVLPVPAGCPGYEVVNLDN